MAAAFLLPLFSSSALALNQLLLPDLQGIVASPEQQDSALSQNSAKGK